LDTRLKRRAPKGREAGGGKRGFFGGGGGRPLPTNPYSKSSLYKRLVRRGRKRKPLRAGLTGGVRENKGERPSGREGETPDDLTGRGSHRRAGKNRTTRRGKTAEGKAGRVEGEVYLGLTDMNEKGRKGTVGACGGERTSTLERVVERTQPERSFAVKYEKRVTIHLGASSLDGRNRATKDQETKAMCELR